MGMEFKLSFAGGDVVADEESKPGIYSIIHLNMDPDWGE
jgi:hypothetical protein